MGTSLKIKDIISELQNPSASLKGKTIKDFKSIGRNEGYLVTFTDGSSLKITGNIHGAAGAVYLRYNKLQELAGISIKEVESKFTEEELEDLLDSAQEVDAKKTYGATINMIINLEKKNGEIVHFQSAGGRSISKFRDSVIGNGYKMTDKWDEPDYVHIVFDNGLNIIIPEAPF